MCQPHTIPPAPGSMTLFTTAILSLAVTDERGVGGCFHNFPATFSSIQFNSVCFHNVPATFSSIQFNSVCFHNVPATFSSIQFNSVCFYNVLATFNSIQFVSTTSRQHSIQLSLFPQRPGNIQFNSNKLNLFNNVRATFNSIQFHKSFIIPLWCQK